MSEVSGEGIPILFHVSPSDPEGHDKRIQEDDGSDRVSDYEGGTVMFKRDSVCKENEQIVLDVLKNGGPMTIRDITRVISGCEVGDMHYSFYARTISAVLCKLLRKGHVGHDKKESEKTVYTFQSDMVIKKGRPRVSEGIHEIEGYTATVDVEGLIASLTKDGVPVRVYIPGDVSGRGIRKEVEMPISADRLRRGLKSGRLAAEVSWR